LSNSKKAFTLIELLVVISIIALLLAILMPSLQRVKQQAQSVVCKTRLRQMATAMVMYCEDNDGKVMAVGWHDEVEAGDYWFSQLKPYLGLSSNAQFDDDEAMAVGFCPSTKVQQPPYSLDGTAKKCWRWQYAPGSVFEGSYGINLWTTVYIGNSNGDTFNEMPAYRGMFWGYRLASVPGRVPVFGDCNWVGNFARSDDERPKEGGYNSETGAYPFEAGSSNVGRYYLDRHNMAINMAFADGHIETLSLEKLWKIKWSKSFKFSDVEID